MLFACNEPNTSVHIDKNNFSNHYKYIDSGSFYFVQHINSNAQVIEESRIQKNKNYNRIISLSNTIIPYLDHLNCLDKLIATSELSFVHNTAYKEKLNQLNCIDLGSLDRLNIEYILQLKPDIVFLSCTYSNNVAQKLKSLNIEVACLDEFLESDPLAVSQWIEYIGLYTNTLPLAKNKFEYIKKEYNEAKKIIQNHQSKKIPFIAGEDIQGIWFAPAPESYVSQIFKDANGEYVLSESNTQKTASIQLSWEQISQTNSQKPFWRFLLHHCDSMNYDVVLKNNIKYKQLHAFNEHKIIYSNTCTNDLFGKGILEPHIQLKDIAFAFDSTIFKNYTPTYYHRLYE